MSKIDVSTLTDEQILALKAEAASMTADRPEQQMAVSIVRTLSKNLSDADWIGLYRGVAPPVVPLNPKQLEALRGGYAQTVGDLLDGWPMPPMSDPNGIPYF